MRSSIKLNLVFSVLYQMLNLAVPLVTAPYVSRVLGSEGIGANSYTSSVASLFVMFVMLGISNYGNREIASLQDNRDARSVAFASIWGFQWLTGTFALAGYGFLCWISRNNTLFPLYCIQSMLILAAILDINWYFYGVERIKVIVLRNACIKIVSVCLIFLFVKNPNDVWIYVAINAGCSLVSSIIILPFLLEDIDFHIPSLAAVLRHSKGIFILFLPVIAVSIYRTIDRIMLGQFADLEQVGYFSNTEKLMDIPMSLVGAIALVMMPRMTALYSSGRQDKASSIMDMSYELIAFLSVGMTVGLMAISQDFVPIFFGNAFYPVIALVSLFAPSIIFMSWANVLRTQYLIPKHRDRIYVISLWIGAVTSIIANLLLIPPYGAAGAVIGTFLAEATVAIYQTYSVRKELPFHKYFSCYAKYFIFAGIMFFAMNFARKMFAGNCLLVVFELIIGGVTYCSLSFGYLYIKKISHL